MLCTVSRFPTIWTLSLQLLSPLHKFVTSIPVIKTCWSLKNPLQPPSPDPFQSNDPFQSSWTTHCITSNNFSSDWPAKKKGEIHHWENDKSGTTVRSCVCFDKIFKFLLVFTFVLIARLDLWRCLYLSFAQLILVTTATTGGGVLFSSQRTFFLRERERDCS